MTDLTARLQAATEGSRELDDAIAREMLKASLPIRLEGMSDAEPSVSVFQYADGSMGTSLRYTTSLDAALTLMPGGWVWTVQIDYELPGRARLFNDDLVPTARSAGIVADAATPVLALCIAIMKAMKAEG